MSGVTLALGAVGALALTGAARRGSRVEAQDAVLYHGTSSALLDTVRRQGLRPPGSTRAATWQGFEGYDEVPDARSLIYATRRPEVARRYAEDTVTRRARRGLPAGEPVVLRIEVPARATVGVDPVMPTSAHAVTLRGLAAVPPEALSVLGPDGSAMPLLAGSRTRGARNRAVDVAPVADGRHASFTAHVGDDYAGELWMYREAPDAALTRPCRYGLDDLTRWLTRRGQPPPQALYRVTTVTVEWAWRRRGVALALYEAALRHAHAEHAALVADGCWETGQTAPEARAVWRKLGETWVVFEDRVGWGVRWDEA